MLKMYFKYPQVMCQPVTNFVHTCKPPYKLVICKTLYATYAWNQSTLSDILNT